ncbi:MAG: GspH/FimT family protein [Phycisphaerae bacterium]|nr:GspH/FimT family protein [Phycisphaerae bacterium]
MRAFTLLEIMVVIVIAAIIGGVALALSGDSDSTAALAGARIVLQDLEFAQSEAICRRSPITVTFNVGAGSYTVSDGVGAITNPVTHQAYVVNLAEESGGAAHLSGASFGAGSAVSFNASGEPVLPGTDTPISSGSGVTVSCGSAVRSVTITPVVGKITAN